MNLKALESTNRRRLLNASSLALANSFLLACDNKSLAADANSPSISLKKALARKAASELQLNQMGVTINSQLPILDISWTGVKVDAQTVAKRLLVMRHLAGAATTDIDVEKLIAWLKAQKLYEALSDAESEYLDDWLDSKVWQSNVDLSWRYEAAWFMAWTLGMFSTIAPPFKPIDEEAAPVWNKMPFAFDNESCADFIAKAQLIDNERILDELDFTYRAYWATQNLRIDKKTKIGRLDREVIMERLRAGNWMMEKNIDWDNVDTST